MLQAKGGPSSMTLTQLRNAITTRALDIEAPGTDRDSGAGIFDALGSVGRTHPSYTDDPIIPKSTVVKARHIQELRDRIDAQRIRCGRSAFSWTDPTVTPGATVIKAVHVAQMRTALNEAYTGCGISPLPSYTNSTLTIVYAVDIVELRNFVVALE